MLLGFNCVALFKTYRFYLSNSSGYAFLQIYPQPYAICIKTVQYFL